ncbi:MATE efflux family protein [Metschnikowia bicuspidata var. bicuspidata NRRL YB-4993]|uniref:MATE efflux family protein n=1 Tax=Metschnikowia bicuspidata var. bicuspidata NRRL YB-4993 TaxID=869754 RepID=A0A1A0HGV2_9ASCO|nr:MATE efflux family protein [Metschnikowia bicuspidata var. bicuspidata NRRL YB-4993]OBA23078.1 MATE efflux family protein [Metschnikowia bicuspidata var. bicuspidata NRRL YB-4993]
MSLIDSEQTLLTGAHDSQLYGSVATRSGHVHISAKEELGVVSRSLAPLVVTFFLQYLLSVVSIYATGRLGPRELAAASLAVCSFNITGLSVYQGMATCLDSFCSQAYGAGRPTMVGVYFQRCSLMMMALTVFPLCPLWWFSGLLLKLMVPDAELAMMSQQYLRTMILGAPALLLFETGKRFLQAQHIFQAGTYVLGVAVPLNFVLNWLLVWHPTYGVGFVGAPLATALSYWATCLLLLLYVLFVDGKKCWGGLDWARARSNWLQMLALALPGVVMVEAEYLAFEVMTILAASFGTLALAAQSIASNVGSLLFQLPFAVSVAVSTRVGHFVGKRKVPEARLVTRVAMVLGVAISVVNFAWILALRNALVAVFTEDADVLRLGADVLVLVAVNQLADGINVMQAGVLRGQGRQRIGSNVNVVSYYAVALPLAYVLAFRMGHGLMGLWAGLVVGVAALAAAESACVWASNWPRILADSEGRHDA